MRYQLLRLKKLVQMIDRFTADVQITLDLKNTKILPSCLYRASTVLRHYFITPN
jgi:hypothetical protein